MSLCVSSSPLIDTPLVGLFVSLFILALFFSSLGLRGLADGTPLLGSFCSPLLQLLCRERAREAPGALVAAQTP